MSALTAEKTRWDFYPGVSYIRVRARTLVVHSQAIIRDYWVRPGTRADKYSNIRGQICSRRSRRHHRRGDIAVMDGLNEMSKPMKCPRMTALVKGTLTKCL